MRGGYLEMNNIHPKTVEEMYKICSINLSPNGAGQIAMSCLTNPPKPGEPSYELHHKVRAVSKGYIASECWLSKGCSVASLAISQPNSDSNGKGVGNQVVCCVLVLQVRGRNSC